MKLFRGMPLSALLRLRWTPVLVAGECWWCEDCGVGGFLPLRERRHRDWCPTRIT